MTETLVDVAFRYGTYTARLGKTRARAPPASARRSGVWRKSSMARTIVRIWNFMPPSAPARRSG